MTASTQRVRHLLTRKRHVVRDSLTVVRHVVRSLARQRFLLRVVVAVVVTTVASLAVWRSFGTPVVGGRRLLVHALVVGIRFAVMLSLQFVVAAWLYRTWCGQAPEKVRHLWADLVRRLPAILLSAVVLAWLDHAAAVSATSLLRSAVTFGFTYLLSYAVPAAAVYGSGLLKGFHHAYKVWRATFGADLLAFAGVWIVNGLMALVSAIPDALDLYTPQSDGERLSPVGRWVNWLVVMPAAIGAIATAAAFTTVILHALEQNRAPEGFPKSPVETVSGLQLDD